MPLCGKKFVDSICRIVEPTGCPKLLALLVGDGGAEVLDFDQALAHEHHLGNF